MRWDRQNNCLLGSGTLGGLLVDFKVINGDKIARYAAFVLDALEAALSGRVGGHCDMRNGASSRDLVGTVGMFDYVVMTSPGDFIPLYHLVRMELRVIGVIIDGSLPRPGHGPWCFWSA